ncbi:hypothetical protein LV89_02539 [Arcicella aurantiaca]|uniref:DUF2442 domain-containing protein n=1 Tax=Arcicella aurantiaca TaxID=591202 RepID=A0A316E9P6_9BACT|nr:hypothetical protein [Arcicella aurantiaca]PWK26368.1 hypothetical protein LV89_02539 [Arcicella aurantiaca]
MKNLEGFQGIQPVIEKVSFSFKDKIAIYLQDGRIIIAPLCQFPSIQQLSSVQRKKMNIVDDQIIMFDDCDEVFHIEQFLGCEQEYKYHLA